MRNGKKQSAYGMLEYRLTDLLEMKYSSDPKQILSIKAKLLSRPVRNKNLHHLPTFILEDALVVIQGKVRRRPKRLFLLDSAKQTFRILPLGGLKWLEEGKSKDEQKLSPAP